MSFNSQDRSVREGAPIECYKFIGELGTYRYTNNNEPVTVAGEVYLPQSSISRGVIETSSLLDSIQTIDVTIPITCPLAVTYSFLKMPLLLDLQIRAVHRGTDFATGSKLIWNGQSVSFPVSGNNAGVKTQSVIQAGLSSQMNQVIFQTSCNHTVYDEHCGLDPADFTTTATVTDIKDHVITVNDDGVADGDLVIGQMVNTRTGESRVIISNVGNIVIVGYAFIDIVLGDTVNLIKGCDNAYSTCSAEFANLINFGGFMFLPSTNPYTDPV